MWTKWIEIITVKEPDKKPYSYRLHCTGYREDLIPTFMDLQPSRFMPEGTIIEMIIQGEE